MSCPYCGEMVRPAQRVCPWCGRLLAAGSPYDPPSHTEACVIDAGVASRRRYAPRGRLGAAALSLLAFLSKLKGVLLLVQFGKFGGMLLTMAVSVAAYALFFGPIFAVGFVALLLAHEMGHWLVLRAKGVPASAPIFVPFLGAVIGMRGRPRNVKDEAEIGIGGPVTGIAAALVVGVAGSLLPAGQPQALLYALAYTGLLLNLFNLIPVSPLDGGRVVAAISRWAWPLGLAILLALFYLQPSPILLLIVLVGGLETIRRFRGTDRLRQVPGYYQIAPRERLMLALAFFVLLVVSFGGMEVLHAQLQMIQSGQV
jgi:Zn-dependent protease